MVQPTPAARGLFRMLVAALRMPGRSPAGTAARLVAGGLGIPGRAGRAAIGLTWLLVLAVWVGLTSALVAGARVGAVPQVVPVVTSVGLLVVAALGAAFVTVLYMVLILRGVRIARRARNRFGSLLAIGLTSVFLYHVLVNVCMTVGLAPVTGLPLPLLSYGGTSLLTSFLQIGLIQNVAMRWREY